MFAIPCLMIAFRQGRGLEMVVLAELPDGGGIIGYDPAVLIITADMQLIFL